MRDDEGKDPQNEEYQRLFSVMRYRPWPFMCDSRNEFFVRPLMAFAACLQPVVAKDRGIRVIFRPYVMRIVAACTDRDFCMSQVQFPAMKTLFEAVHHIFFQFIFLNYLFIPVASAAGFHLLLTTDLRGRVLNREDIMRRSMAVYAERAISLVFFGNVPAVYTLEYFLVNFTVTFAAGSGSHGVNRIFLGYF